MEHTEEIVCRVAARVQLVCSKCGALLESDLQQEEITYFGRERPARIYVVPCECLQGEGE